MASETNTVTISHDPFARLEVVRKIEHGKSCDWCGQKRNRNGKPIDGLFVYGSQEDGLNTNIKWCHGRFCSIGCFNMFHG